MAGFYELVSLKGKPGATAALSIPSLLRSPLSLSVSTQLNGSLTVIEHPGNDKAKTRTKRKYSHRYQNRHGGPLEIPPSRQGS